MNERLQQLKDFLVASPSDPFLKYALATEYLKLGHVDEALGYYEDLRQNHPDYVGTYYHLGKLYERLGKRDEAIMVYEQGMETAKNRRDTHALSELQTVHRSLLGIDEDDEDE